MARAACFNLLGIPQRAELAADISPGEPLCLSEAITSRVGEGSRGERGYRPGCSLAYRPEIPEFEEDPTSRVGRLSGVTIQIL